MCPHGKIMFNLHVHDTDVSLAMESMVSPAQGLSVDIFPVYYGETFLSSLNVHIHYRKILEDPYIAGRCNSFNYI